MFGGCVGCFKAKRSTKYCRQIKGHKGDKAAPCPSCFEQGISVSECRLDHRHCGPGVSWCTTTITEAKENNKDLSLPVCCCYQLAREVIPAPLCVVMKYSKHVLARNMYWYEGWHVHVPLHISTSHLLSSSELEFVFFSLNLPDDGVSSWVM